MIAQSIGQAFSVAYQEFLRANGINPEDLSQKEYSDLLNTQDMYNDDLIHFSKSENCKDVCWTVNHSDMILLIQGQLTVLIQGHSLLLQNGFKEMLLFCNWQLL